MRISDWSSDVCSSDLCDLRPDPRRLVHHHGYVAGSQRQLLFDFLPVEHPDPDRLVREATARACRLDDDLASVLAFLASRGILRVRWRYQTHLRGNDHDSGQSPTRKKINIQVNSRTHTLRQKRMNRRDRKSTR